MALNTEAATGQQTTTQNPQTVPAQAPGASVRSNSVQSGTPTTLLDSQQGVVLGGAAPTTVSLVNTGVQTETGAASKPAPKPEPHKVNAVWVGIPLVLCLAAVVMFWAMSRSAKSTTN